MPRTALMLIVEEQRAYQPDKHLGDTGARERWKRAWEAAGVAADLLRDKCGATRVVALGSVTRPAWLTPWSDIDLVAWGIAADRFYRAVAMVAGLIAEFEIDLVDTEDCRPALRRIIDGEGVKV